MKSKVTESGCWEWQGTLGQLGYGQTTFQNKKWIVHRLSYFVFKGDLRGLDVCHTCDNKKCCNPDHLWLGTHIENMDDHVFKGRHYELRKTHCVRGHPLSGDNLAWRFNRKRRRPTRICKECIRTRWRRERDQKANKC